jgi:hypothetical protein
MDDSMRDWPLPLKLNAASCAIAAALYDATCDVYGPWRRVDFTELNPRIRQRYIEAARDAIVSAKPQPAPRVIGSITPSEPYGVTEQS